MREVKWIYGEQLGRRSATARSEEEIAQFAAQGPVDVHLVEVCVSCRWNYLLSTATVEI